MINAIIGIINGMMGVADKLIIDQDKKIEFAYKTQELVFAVINQLIAVKTVPAVDAIVKILMALVVFARPIGSFILTLKGIDMASITGELDVINVGLISLFPSWMGFRQYDKYKKTKVTVDNDADNLFG